MPPDFLAVGHIVKDLTSEGWRPGGAVFYAAAQAQRLGLRVAAVTSCGPELDPAAILPGVEWRVRASHDTTTFENTYLDDGRRHQRVLAQADAIVVGDVPADWSLAPIIFLGSVFHDIDPALCKHLDAQDRLVGLGAQGWLRRLVDGHVAVDAVKPTPDWLAGDVVFVSEEDITNFEQVFRWRRRVPVVALTRSSRGCTVWNASGRHDMPAFDTKEFDATGAGDVFAAAFLIRYHETGDALLAERFASAAAALAVGGTGIERLAGRAAIESLLARQPAISAS